MALKIPCFLCGDLLTIKLTKKDKPVITCNSCGVQSFVRYPRGIERLHALAENRASLKERFRWLGYGRCICIDS
ncbi:MAG: hypothetical protein HY644_05895 [Acidobacteria bacterium]|nr:hypothetical protein [Acidobacteriota bacterium]